MNNLSKLLLKSHRPMLVGRCGGITASVGAVTVEIITLNRGNL